MGQRSNIFHSESKVIPIIWAVVISILVTALIVGTGVYWWQKSSAEREKKKLHRQIKRLRNQISDLNKKLKREEAKQSTRETKESAAPDEYEGWKTYTNFKYGYTMRYPADWTVEEKSYTETDIGIEREYVEFISSDKRYLLSFGLKKEGSDIVLSGRTGMPAGEFVEDGEITIGGTKVKITHLVYKDKVKVILYSQDPIDGFKINGFVAHAEFGYIGDAGYEEYDLLNVPEREIAHKILQSFQFTS